MAFALACLTIAAAQTPPSDRHALMAQQIAQEVRRNLKIVESPPLVDYLTRLGSKLAAAQSNTSLPFKFTLVSELETGSLHEPIALPEGDVFIPVSLLLAADDEAEFAGMLAQAIARAPYLITISEGSIPWTFTCGSGHALASAADRCRAVELQADASAVVTMSHAGFNPAALLRYIARVDPARIPPLEVAIRNLPPQPYMESGEFYAIQQQARPAPAKPRLPPTLLRP
jgi:predicted Zn-dependent protease